MTPEGQQAYDLMEWAWQDPQARVQDALSQVAELARQASGAALAEIQDSGVMLDRLASSLEPVTITDQLTADTILSQIITMARDPAWLHEHRGPHGEWERAGIGGVSERISNAQTVQRQAKANRLARERAERLDAARQALAEQQASTQDVNRLQSIAANMPLSPPLIHGTNIAEISEAEAKKRLEAMPLLPGEDKAKHLNPLPGETMRENLLHEQILHQRVAPLAESKAASVLEAARKHVADQLKLVATAQDTEEGRKARQKAIIETGVNIAIAGISIGALALGAPAIAAIIGTLVAMLAQVGLEMKGRL